MDYQKLLKEILDIGKEMIKSGAEVWRADDSVRRMLSAYGFTHCDLWVISTCIEVTAEAPDGNIYTQIRDIGNVSTNLDKLDHLNALSRYACENTPDHEELHRRFSDVLARPGVKRWVKYAASVMAGAGFTVFFNGDLADAAVAVLASILVVRIGEIIGSVEKNPMIYNAFVAFFLEVLIIGSVYGEVGHNMSTITIGVIMLLISALGLTNGIRDLLQRNTLSGISTISTSILGAGGIAIGISLAMLLFRRAVSSIVVVPLVPNHAIQLISGTVGCLGFALLFGIKGKQVAYSGVGAFFTWVVYLLASEYIDSSIFVSTLVAAAFVAVYSTVMARVNKAPATVFLTASVFPLIPGSALYYTVYGAIMRDLDMLVSQGNELLFTCLGIAFGFIVVEFLMKYVGLFLRMYLSEPDDR